MKKSLKWLILIGTIITTVIIWSFTTINNSQVKVENVEKIKNKNKESLFKPVENIGRLEFFKMDAMMNKKFLMVYFYTNNCSYCIKMKNKTFSNVNVQKELLNNYSSVTINYSKYKNNFKSRYNLKGTPYIIFFDKEGNEIENERIYGYLDAENFKNKINMIVKTF